MNDNDQNNTSLDNADDDLTPDTLTENNQRSLDIGAQGQYAPGGVYNQQGATQTDRIDLDEQTSSALDDKS
ncbi:MAG TPA: hypothetical protein VEX70_09045 [Pyrinomonadaceae bacterium]|jgi:hypothetical protein|nr:hypothetical protein [Pyrinomonadaceae bacterium]